MQRLLLLVKAILITLFFYSCNDVHKVTSPDGTIVVNVQLENGNAYYEVWKDDKVLFSRSELGFLLKDQPALAGNFKIASVSQNQYNETWVQPWGEVKNIDENYNRVVVSLEETTAPSRKLNVEFKVFDDGLGFRYEFPEQENLKDFIITDELTEFNLVHDMEAWWIPAYSDATDYEILFSKNKVSSIKENVHTPITMEQGDSLFVSIHEAGLKDYAAMTLLPMDGGLKCELVPWSTGDLVVASAPQFTPWRSIQIAKSAGDLITSYLILNLNEPSKIEDTSWITTGKYAGIWWGMHVNTQTWGSGPQHGASTSNVKEVIDFAAQNNLKGVLVEGWNKGWDGDWSSGEFDFDEPYPDFDIEEISQYAKDNGVSIIGHHETGGNIENYEAQLAEAFAFCNKYNIPAVKTGYVTKKINGKEWHQSQFSVNHYNLVTKIAAEHKVMLDMHEPVKATGLRRTYPNLMTREGARGTEYEAWSDGNPPEHTLVLPFTRCLAGPLDYTPGIFDINIKTRPDNKVHTTLAKQLALYVTIYSPWQMAADLPENYKDQPALQFIRDVPTDWEDTKVLNAKIGDFLTIVRKDRESDNWYLGSITDENARSMEVSLDFLIPGKKYKAEIYADGSQADVDTNPTDILIETKEVSSDKTLEIKLARGGGQAIRFQLLN